MRVHRVWVPSLAAGEVAVRGPEAHHLARVLRVRPGAPVEAFDGVGREAAGTVAACDADTVVLRLEPPAPAASEPRCRVTLAVGLLKGDKLAEVVRHGTELGVAAVRPLHTRHADVPALSRAKVQRYRRVALEACKQARRARVPEVAEPVALDALTWEGAAVVADPASPPRLGAVLRSRPEAVTFISGPEGGLDAAEVAALVARGAVATGLGPRILRAETAPLALAAATLLLEDE